ncbi:HK97 family phage prohead protease [Massilia sp. DWR3-1-1]|uniref:HK97 family phage prohead protease n=1 Tax=Massilia sp. DWR3-1-1 TaxID=2804559 RepID=UPI003CEB9FB0
MTLQISLPLLELRSESQGLISGYGAVFGGVDSYGDTIIKGAFRETLAQHKANGSAPVMLWAHKPESPVGRWTEMFEDARGLKLTGQINMRTSAGTDAFEHLRAGDINGLSIGYRVPQGGSEFREGVNFLKRIDLAEVSIVSVPADSAARISSVKAQAIKPATVRALEEALKEMGYSRNEARSIAAKGFSGLGSAPDKSNELIAALSAASQLFTKAPQ